MTTEYSLIIAIKEVDDGTIVTKANETEEFNVQSKIDVYDKRQNKQDMKEDGVKYLSPFDIRFNRSIEVVNENTKVCMPFGSINELNEFVSKLKEKKEKLCV